jgi:hypothetical protein
MAAGAATLALGTAGVAYAQSPPSVTVTASVSPSAAGTTAKPKNEKFTLKVTNDPASKTTAKSIAITFPSTLKLSTKGLPQCTKTDTQIVDSLGSVCKSAKIGSGTAHALINPFATSPTPVSFVVTAYAGKNELLFLLKASIGATYVTHGKISGKKLTITIGKDLQQPITNTYSALLDLSTSLSMKKGSNYLISSTGCKSKAHKIGVTVGYAPNPNPPAAPSASGTTNAKCS